MIPNHDKDLGKGDGELWVHEWWHERKQYPSLLWVGLEEPLRKDLHILVESRAFLYLNCRLGDANYLKSSPILIDENLTEDTSNRLEIVLDHIKDVQGISYYHAMEYLIFLYVFCVDMHRRANGEKSILFTDRADQYPEPNALQATNENAPSRDIRPAAWSISQLVEFWAEYGGKFAKGLSTAKDQKWYCGVVPPVQISLKVWQEISELREEGRDERHEIIKASRQIALDDIYTFDRLLEIHCALQKKGGSLQIAHSRISEEDHSERVVESRPKESDIESFRGHTSEVNRFYKEGKYWSIIYRGQQLPLMPNEIGFAYIFRLLQSPRQNIASKTLIQGVQQTRTDYNTSGTYTSHDISDEKAIKEIGKHLQELREEQEEAQHKGDEERYDEIQTEIDELLKYHNPAIGLGGRSRKFGQQDEKARSSVKKAIDRARTKIKDQCPALAQHLEMCIETGYSCSYNPDYDNFIEWTF